ncbi:hypothetical protein CY34DRAFT_805624 [Suillus luteus UH-Slu-Lm8-n1]|uniref:Uncharacterized protein n=1 Tax=Suillus luteus UH-Slu-Lm8-n1 TaxID=930992 RepID=A0A0D0AIU2_9AGAM|nr:hypothetical protein CY34DRAFT_805624 [Suillus luteus UH-Slu-Lm8-n1]
MSETVKCRQGILVHPRWKNQYDKEPINDGEEEILRASSCVRASLYFPPAWMVRLCRTFSL